MTNKTAAELYAIIDTFETSTLPPMSNAWDDLRKAAIEAMKELDAMKGQSS